jgi:hypothetical protein
LSVFLEVDATLARTVADLSSRPGTTVHEFQPVYVLSRLRTAAYRAALSGRKIAADPSFLLSAVAVMSENCLWYRCAPPDVMAEQMRHLMHRAEKEEIRILPVEARISAPVGHAFHIYGGDTVVVGIVGAKFFTQDRGTVDHYLLLFDELRALAVTGSSAESRIEQALTAHKLEGRSHVDT